MPELPDPADTNRLSRKTRRVMRAVLWTIVFGIGGLVGYLHSPFSIAVRTLPRWPVGSIILYGIAVVGLPLSIWRFQAAIDKGWKVARLRIISWSTLALALGITLGTLTTREALAERPLGSPCVTQTQECVTGTLLSDSTSCTAPTGAIITRYQLSIAFSQGGEVTLNGKPIQTVPPEPTGFAKELLINASVAPGQHYLLRVVARGTDSQTPQSGTATKQGIVFGRAALQFYGIERP